MKNDELKIRMIGALNAVAYLALWGASIVLLFFPRVTHLDMMSRFFVFVIATVSLATALYSIGFVSRDVAQGVITAARARLYYMLFNLFNAVMLVVPLVDNLGMMWVAIEMTTLVSAFLVGFSNTKASVEAAWKYIIICSAGIILALLGTILFFSAFAQAGGARSLRWTDMMAGAAALDPGLIKIAFIFILVGYGTKAGLAPMHTWLPDAHSQAVAPISALLSGVLLKTSLYAILRFGMITNKCCGASYFGNLMLLFGCVSICVSAGFLIVQKDLKRLLAYSSIEHIGIIAVGVGLGTPLALIGAFMHIFNHAVTKALMFFGAGNVVSVYKKHNMNSIRGVIKVMPFTGAALLLGVFALTGLPPFSIFFSEFLILLAAFGKGAYGVAGLMLSLLAVIFGAMVFGLTKILFGPAPKDGAPYREPLSGKMAFCFLIIQICLVGLLVPFLWTHLGSY